MFIGHYNSGKSDSRGGRRKASHSRRSPLTPEQGKNGARAPRYEALQEQAKNDPTKGYNAKGRFEKRLAAGKILDRMATPFVWKTDSSSDMVIVEPMVQTVTRHEECRFYSEMKREYCALEKGHEERHFDYKEEVKMRATFVTKDFIRKAHTKKYSGVKPAERVMDTVKQEVTFGSAGRKMWWQE